MSIILAIVYIAIAKLFFNNECFVVVNGAIFNFIQTAFVLL